MNNHVLSIAPMIDWTNNHFRMLMRLLAPNALLYTEMQTVGAILHNPQRALLYHPKEQPLAIQLGGSNPKDLALCAKIAEEAGFVEVNLNLGCPSKKVQSGLFGACLMREPLLVAECIHIMQQNVSIPVTAKTRIGIDNEDSYAFFHNFVSHIIQSGCQKLIVHARKAWLQGLNPRQNRTIPPVHYDYVYKIKTDFPKLLVHINGNIQNAHETETHLRATDGVMFGRLAINDPYQIAQIHQSLYPQINSPKRSQIFEQYLHYLLNQASTGISLSLLIRPLFNLAFNLCGSSQWKKKLMAILQTKNWQALLTELVQYLEEIESMLEA